MIEKNCWNQKYEMFIEKYNPCFETAENRDVERGVVRYSARPALNTMCGPGLGPWKEPDRQNMYNQESDHDSKQRRSGDSTPRSFHECVVSTILLPRSFENLFFCRKEPLRPRAENEKIDVLRSSTGWALHAYIWQNKKNWKNGFILPKKKLNTIQKLRN